LAKKNPKWLEIASILSKPARKQRAFNLDLIEKQSETGDIMAVPGKVLSLGEVNKKIRIAAINYSEKAKEKLIKSGCEIKELKQEIKDNKDAKAVKIVKNENN